MHSFLAIQNTYEVFEIALFINNTFVDKQREDKRHASKLFIPLLDELLTKNNAKISDFDFCAVNCGPGPFSTLRSIIASVNGLHLATQLPLIGIDGLDATFLEFYDNSYQNTVVLLNAFNNEVYYCIAHQDQVLSKGYQKIDAFLHRAHSSAPHPTNFIGNGVTLHHDLIKQIYGNSAIIKQNNPPMCSIETIGRLGLEKFINKDVSDGYLMPLHLKKHAVEL